jgi:hypothetical protein
VCGSEIWAITEMDRKRLVTWERKIMRRIYGPGVEQGMWRIRSNQELRKMHKDLDLAADIKKERLEWNGHVVRMDQGKTVNKVFESKPEGSRRSGRPSKRWLEDVEKDKREMATEGS